MGKELICECGSFEIAKKIIASLKEEGHTGFTEVKRGAVLVYRSAPRYKIVK